MADSKKQIFRSQPGLDVKVQGPFASVFISDGEDNGDQGDFRQVPDSDRGNAAYRDVGQRGSYAPHNRDNFPDPAGLKRFAGYGADEEDLRLGFCKPRMNDDPAYDLENYKDRSTLPNTNDEDFENTSTLARDYEFRGRNRNTRGLFKRPHIPTER